MTETAVLSSERGIRARRAYVGCRTSAQRNARGRAIEVFEVLEDGRWGHRHSVPAGSNPSYLALNAAEDVLHCVHGEGESVSSFAVLPDGNLSRLGECAWGGRNPVHLAFSPGGRWMVVANYATGTLASLPVQADGSLGEVRHILRLPDRRGPYRSQQQGSHPHQVMFDPSGRWLLVPDKGADAVHTLSLDEESGALERVHSLQTPAGSGPRHLAFGENRNGWLVLELASQLMSFAFDAESGILRPTQRLMSVPDSFVEENTAAGIAHDQERGLVMVSNRGHGSVAVFGIDPASGRLRDPFWIRTEGAMPRFIGLQARNLLLVANEDSDSIQNVDLARSPPSAITNTRTGSPVCVVFTKGNS